MNKGANFRLFWKTLKNCGFRVRARVSDDNHPANVLAYKLPLKESGYLNRDLSVEHDYEKNLLASWCCPSD